MADIAQVFSDALHETYTAMAADFKRPYGHVRLQNGERRLHSFFHDASTMFDLSIAVPVVGIERSTLKELVQKYAGERAFSFMVNDPQNGYGGFRLGQTAYDGKNAMYDIACDATRMSSPTREVFVTALSRLGVGDNLSTLKGQANPWGTHIGLEDVLDAHSYLSSRQPPLDIHLTIHGDAGKASHVSFWDRSVCVSLKPGEGFLPEKGKSVSCAQLSKALKDFERAGTDFSGDWTSAYAERPGDYKTIGTFEIKR